MKVLIQKIDRVNNAVHNTGESVLSKMNDELLDAFEDAHKGNIKKMQQNSDFNNIQQWFKNVDQADKKSDYMKNRWGVWESSFEKTYNNIINEINTHK